MEEKKGLLKEEDLVILRSFDEGAGGYFYYMLEYLENFIETGVREERFTEQEAHEDLEIALWYAFACNNIDDYEHYYMATQWMPDSEKNAAGCGAWYYRYSAALMYCGKLEAALEYAECGVQEEPDYPWGWLQAGKLRSHFGNKQGALEAVRRGLELEPGDYEFLTLQKEIMEERSIEEMEFHYVDPSCDKELQDGMNEEVLGKCRAIAGIVCSEERLKQVKEIFHPISWAADCPYCSGYCIVQGGRIELVFRMNEAALSKMNIEWLEEQKKMLDTEVCLTRTDDDGNTCSLEAVQIDRDYSVTLTYRNAEDDTEILISSRSEIDRQSLEESGEEEPLNMDNALDYVIRHSLHGNLGTEDVVEGDSIYCPAWQMVIRPQIEQLTNAGAVLSFYLSSPEWGKELYECAVGMGKSAREAIGMACGSFLFSFMQGIVKMEQKAESETMETSFAGKAHRWKVYLSDVVGMGEAPKLDSPNVYWAALKESIIKRLGNQKLCYVKIYGAKSFGEVTGECRIDDIKSEELSALVARMVEKWDVEQFASHKMFFFIRQEDETTLPDHYLGIDGFERLKENVKIAAKLFHSCETREQYEELSDRLEQEMEDRTLAAECYAFLPEICAENAFNGLSYPETVEIQVGRQTPVTCYKNQLADYWRIHNALFSLFEEGEFGEEANQIYQKCISVSSIYNLVKQMKEKGVDLEEGRLTTLLFQVAAGFEIR